MSELQTKIPSEVTMFEVTALRNSFQPGERPERHFVQPNMKSVNQMPQDLSGKKSIETENRYRLSGKYLSSAKSGERPETGQVSAMKPNSFEFEIVKSTEKPTTAKNLNLTTDIIYSQTG